VAGLRTLLQP